MGEGLYWSRDGRTAYAEPYDDLDLADPDLWGTAYDDLVDTIRSLLSDAWEPVEREWRGRTERIVARNALHEVWLDRRQLRSCPRHLRRARGPRRDRRPCPQPRGRPRGGVLRPAPDELSAARPHERVDERGPGRTGGGRMTHRITLQSKPSPHFGESHKRWQVLLNGEPWGEPFYYNMRGYRGVLPRRTGGASIPAR